MAAGQAEQGPGAEGLVDKMVGLVTGGTTGKVAAAALAGAGAVTGEGGVPKEMLPDFKANQTRPLFTFSAPETQSYIQIGRRRISRHR
jgi:hypothetical protein